MKQRHQQKLVIMSMILLLGLNFPLLLLFDSTDCLLGFPVIYIYIFSVWMISALISFIIIKRYHE